MVLALRALLRVALSDPANSYFQLLCETSIPLYHPALVYREVMRSPMSHVNTCPPAPGGPLVSPSSRKLLLVTSFPYPGMDLIYSYIRSCLAEYTVLE